MRAGILAVVATGIVMAAGGAQAMKPPQVYEDARANAAYHLRIEISAMQPRSGQAIDDCRVEGNVVGILRDEESALAIGDLVSFEVKCVRADADPNLIPDCMLYMPTESLVEGQLLEAYLNRSTFGGFALAEDQVQAVQPGAASGDQS